MRHHTFDLTALPAELPAVDLALLAETLEPRPTERPCPQLRPPLSAKRAYTADERCLAADLLARLHRGNDLRPLAARVYNPDHVIDTIADRLLRVL